MNSFVDSFVCDVSKISETIQQRNPGAIMLPDYYNSALVGYTDDNCAVYNIETCIQIIMEDKECSRKEAEIELGFMGLSWSKLEGLAPVLAHFPQIETEV